jgi:hypothetical protein
MAPISYELISVTYAPPPPDIVLEEKVKPEGNFQIINNTDVIRSDSAQFTKTYSTTYSHTFTDETAASIGAEISFTAGIPEFGEMGAKITAVSLLHRRASLSFIRIGRNRERIISRQN